MRPALSKNEKAESGVSYVPSTSAAQPFGGASEDIAQSQGRAEALELAKREGWRMAIAAAAEECRRQQSEFLSPEYAIGQPLSSFGERFACGCCAEAIEALPLPEPPEATNA
jgi:hypothetical protein